MSPEAGAGDLVGRIGETSGQFDIGFVWRHSVDAVMNTLGVLMEWVPVPRRSTQ
jgi:hypothetical protein